MFKLRVAVLEDHDIFRNTVSNIIREKGHYVEAFSSPPDLNSLREFDLALFDIDLGRGKETGIEFGKRVKEKLSNLPILIMTMHDAQDYLFNYAVEQNFDGWIPKSGIEVPGKKRRFDELLFDKIDYLGKIKKLKIPMDFGLIGLGNIGKRTLEWAVDSEFIKKISIYSKYNNNLDSYNSIIDSFELIGLEERNDYAVFHKSLEELFSTSPDILAITTGPKYIPGRTRIEELTYAAPMVYPILKKIAELNYQGSVLISSNPVEIFMEMGRQMGLSELNMVGVSPDPIRTRKLTQKYERERGEVNILTAGCHGPTVFPLLSSSTIRGESLKGYLTYREKLTEKLSEMGKRSMDAKEETGMNIGVSSALKEIITSLSTMRENLSSYSRWDPKREYFTEGPIQVYPSLTFKANEYPSMDEWEEKKLEKDIAANSNLQKTLARDFLKSVTRKV
jgi:malate/lactate dehydrogenase/CheY-like chemotaxis protein